MLDQQNKLSRCVPMQCTGSHLSVTKALKLEGIGVLPEPLPLEVPSMQAPHMSESPYWSVPRATVFRAGIISLKGGRHEVRGSGGGKPH